MPELTQAQKSGYEQHRKDGASPNEGDYIWLIGIKCRARNALDDALNNSSAEVMKRLGASKNDMIVEESGGLPKYCWQYRFVSTTYKEKPEITMYSSRGDGKDPNSEYVGYCRFIGRVAEVQGNREQQLEATAAARTVQAGLPGWQLEISKLKKMVIHLNVY